MPFQQHVGLDLHGPQAGSRIGREERVADACSEDHDAALFKVPHRPPANIRLSYLVHEHRCHHPALHIALLQRILQGDGVDHRGQHAHVVGGDPVHFLGLLSHAAKEIAASDNNPDLDTQRVNIGNLAGDCRRPFRRLAQIPSDPPAPRPKA